MRMLHALLLLGAAGVAVRSQTASLDQVIAQLRQGGYVLVMRHASSPRQPPTKEQANADNVKLERQLDVAGRRTATAMGHAVRALNIPVVAVLSSPTYRAMETVRLAGFASPEIVEELGDGGQSMQGITDAQATWLRRTASEPPLKGNLLLVTHQPNLSKAFPSWGASVEDGETVVVRPDGKGGTTVVARIPIDRWPELR
jgi:phosphohistidine phosphatase SixA